VVAKVDKVANLVTKAIKEDATIVMEAVAMDKEHAVVVAMDVEIKDMELATTMGHLARCARSATRSGAATTALTMATSERRSIHSLARISLSLDQGRHLWLLQTHDIISIPVTLDALLIKLQVLNVVNPRKDLYCVVPWWMD
jgi:hypothetical protein